MTFLWPRVGVGYSPHWTIVLAVPTIVPVRTLRARCVNTVNARLDTVIISCRHQLTRTNSLIRTTSSWPLWKNTTNCLKIIDGTPVQNLAAVKLTTEHGRYDNDDNEACRWRSRFAAVFCSRIPCLCQASWRVRYWSSSLVHKFAKSVAMIAFLQAQRHLRKSISTASRPGLSWVALPLRPLVRWLVLLKRFLVTSI